MKRKQGRPRKQQISEPTMKRTKPGSKKQKPVATVIPEVQDMKELIFAQEYLTDLDPIGAALRTGLVSMRLKMDEQETEALKIFNRPTVQQYIKKAIQDRMVRIGITEDKLLRELNNMACFDPIALKDEYGDFKALEDIPADIRKCIQELKVNVKYKQKNGQKIPVGHITDIKLYSKLDAVKTLLSHFKGDADNKPNINYTQFNIGNQVNSNSNNITTNNTIQQIDMSDFTDEELQIIRKMSGNQDPYEFIELQQIERQYYDAFPAEA
jgi:hypothetical protein